MKRNPTFYKRFIVFLLISLMIVGSTTNTFAVAVDNVNSSSQKDDISSISSDNLVTLTQDFNGIQEGNKYCPGIKNYPDLPFYVYLQKEGTSSDKRILEDGISIDEGNYKIRVLEPTPNAYTHKTYFPYSIFVFIGGKEISLDAKTGTKTVNSNTYSICTSNEYYHFTGNEEISVKYTFADAETINIRPIKDKTTGQVTLSKNKGFSFYFPANIASLGIINVDKYFKGYQYGSSDTKNLVFDNESNTYIIDTPNIGIGDRNYNVLWSDTPILDIDYTVSYSYTGAPSGTTPPPPVNGKVGQTISLPSEPSIAGATFLGWYYNNEKIENATTILGNMQIVGKFESSIDPTVTFSETGETGIVKINESIIHSGDTVPQGYKNITITPPDGYIVKNVTNLDGIIVNSNGEATVNHFPIFDDINFDITYAEKPEFTIESKEIHFNENIDNPAHLTKGPNDGTFNYTSSETSKIICNGSNVTTSDHITSAAKNVTCYATYTLGLWTSSPIEYTISVIKPTVSKSDQTLIYGESKHVEYGLTNNNQAAYEKTIDGTNYPYFSFSSSNPDKISVDEDNNISTGTLDDDEYATAGITVTYHVNPNCTYSSTYKVDTANISSFSWYVSKDTLKLGDTITCIATPSLDCSSYGYKISYKSSVSTSSAKVSIDQDTGELTYTKAPSKENNYVTITAEYKNGSKILASSTYSINLGGVTIKSNSGVNKSIIDEKDQSVNIFEVSQPIVTGEGVGDESNYEYTYKITSGQEYVTQDSKDPALFTSIAPGATKISVSAKLKNSSDCINSTYTFTITGNYEDDTPFEPKGCKVSVAGNISAYIWMTIPKAYRMSGTYVKFTYDTKLETKNIIVDFNNADIDVIASDLVYGFPCEIAAKEMTTNITYALYDSNNTMISDKEYSFNLYDNYFNSPKINKSQLQDTINKLQNYGARAQLHFNFNTSKLANANLTESQKALSSAQDVFEQTKSSELSISGQEPGVSYYGASLVTESLLRTKMYFVVENGFSVPICTINGKNVTAEKAGKTSKGIIYYITSEGDTLKSAGDISQYRIGNMVIKYSPLSYIHSITGSSSANETNKNVTIAMYDYYKSIPDEE